MTFARSLDTKRAPRVGLALALGLAVLAAACSTTVDHSKMAASVTERTRATCGFIPDLHVVIDMLKRSGGRSSDDLVASICRAVAQVPPEKAAAASRSLTVIVNGKEVPGRLES